MLRVLGLCILLFALYIFLKSHRQRGGDQLVRYEWMASLLAALLREMECYMRPISDVLPSCVKCDGEGAEMLLSAAGRNRILSRYDADAARLLSDYFESAGSTYIDSELMRLRSVKSEFDKMVGEKRRRLNERNRLSGILGGAGALALFILLV